MKLAISTAVQIVFLIIGLPFFIMQKLGSYGVSIVDKACNRANWWGRK